jgi:FAD/FMN-containing dehydrogenase
VRATYGPNFDRLAELKRKYDPDNLFRTNRNIRP